MKNHQKHSRGVQIIRKMMAADFAYSDSLHLDNFVYVSQLVQADGITKAIEAHRIRHQHCRGTLYWQLNDCWPVASWSSIDCQGHWKALHYRLREAYANVAVAVECDASKNASVYLINDSLKNVKGDLTWALFSLNGKMLATNTLLNVVAPTNSSTCVAICNLNDIALANKIPLDTQNLFLKIQYFQNGKILAEKVFCFTTPGNLKLKKSPISQHIEYKENEIALTLSSATYQKGVFVSDESGKNIQWSDNFFDLVPNEPKTIYGHYDSTDGGCPQLKVTSFNEVSRK